jgi:NAD(P) transhydrogenase subunit alpha
MRPAAGRTNRRAIAPRVSLGFPPAASACRTWTVDLLTELTIFVLACFVGFEVISKVPNTLHTPLMSGTNAIHGIVIVGGILAIAVASGDTLGKVLAVVAVAFGTINVVGGFLVTDRMLEMFRKRPTPKRAAAASDDAPPEA